MSVAKTVEITSRSSESFQDAVEQGIEKAAETIKGMKQAWVSGQKVFIDGDNVTGYQVDLKITFVVD
jgi:flavin-binding protein dodecin